MRHWRVAGEGCVSRFRFCVAEQRSTSLYTIQAVSCPRELTSYRERIPPDVRLDIGAGDHAVGREAGECVPELAWCPAWSDPGCGADGPKKPAHIGRVQWLSDSSAENKVLGLGCRVLVQCLQGRYLQVR
jgi:hypothetical protein